MDKRVLSARVILSEAKDLARISQMLRFAQHDVFVVVILICFVCLNGCRSKEQPTLGHGTLANLMLPIEGRAAHESSYDRTGGNFDLRPLEPGQTITLFDQRGAGVIRRFWCTIAPRANMKLHRQMILRMYWDDEKIPSVECPVGDFFGVGFGEQVDFISLPLNQASGGYNCYWPMPFHRSARWTLTNLSDQRCDAFYYNIDYTHFDHLDADVRHFKAQWRRENPTTKDKNYTLLETTGEGHYVGVAMFMQAIAPHDLQFLEGDEMIFIDGANQPQIIGTGSEDYFSSGWYYDRGPYSAPYHGVQIKDERNARINTYRWHVEDAMPFNKGIRVTIEHGTNNNCTSDYSSIAFYYQKGETVAGSVLPKDARDLLPTPVKEVKRIAGAIEGEMLAGSAKATGGRIEAQSMTSFGFDWSNDAQLWWRDGEAGSVLSIPLPAQQDGEYDVIVHLTRASDYGQVALQAGDGAEVKLDGYAPSVSASGPILLGRVRLTQGQSKLLVRITGKNEKSKGTLFGLDAIELKR
jgi:hypothetical protein